MNRLQMLQMLTAIRRMPDADRAHYKKEYQEARMTTVGECLDFMDYWEKDAHSFILRSPAAPIMEPMAAPIMAPILVDPFPGPTAGAGAMSLSLPKIEPKVDFKSPQEELIKELKKMLQKNFPNSQMAARIRD